MPQDLLSTVLFGPRVERMAPRVEDSTSGKEREDVHEVRIRLHSLLPLLPFQPEDHTQCVYPPVPRVLHPVHPTVEFPFIVDNFP